MGAPFYLKVSHHSFPKNCCYRSIARGLTCMIYRTIQMGHDIIPLPSVVYHWKACPMHYCFDQSKFHSVTMETSQSQMQCTRLKRHARRGQTNVDDILQKPLKAACFWVFPVWTIPFPERSPLTLSKNRIQSICCPALFRDNEIFSKSTIFMKLPSETKPPHNQRSECILGPDTSN